MRLLRLAVVAWLVSEFGPCRLLSACDFKAPSDSSRLAKLNDLANLVVAAGFIVAGGLGLIEGSRDLDRRSR